jgi:uncharacterized membrane protein
LSIVVDEKPKRRRPKKSKLCEHGYPSIPDPRGCAACWTKHPGYTKPKPKERKPPEGIHQVTCEKCFLPAQSGSPPMVRIAAPAGEAAKYEHRVCPSDMMAGATLPRRQRRSFRRGLASSLRRHMRKMVRIKRARRERAVVLRIETARAERLLAAKEKEKRGRRKARAAG